MFLVTTYTVPPQGILFSGRRDLQSKMSGEFGARPKSLFVVAQVTDQTFET